MKIWCNGGTLWKEGFPGCNRSEDSKSKLKIKINYYKNEMVKLNIIKPESFTRFKFSRINAYQGRVWLASELK